MSKMKKYLLTGISYVLVAALAIGGTIAYLQDSDEDVNVMTLGNVQIDQIEQEWNADQTELVEFTQAKPLYPYVGELGWKNTNNYAYRQFTMNNVVDKYVTVKNTGKSDAYVRTLIAFELGEMTAAKWENTIGVALNSVTSTGADFTGTWAWGPFDAAAPVINVDGHNYLLYVATHQNPVKPGETTIPSLLQVYMYNTATNEDVKAIDGNGNGTYDILVLSQAVQTAGFENAKTALDTAFGAANVANATTWFSGNEFEVPTAVSNADALIEALEGGKDVVLADDVKIEPANMSNAYGTTGINVKNGQTVDGGNNTLNIKGAGGTWDSGINTTGGLIKDITITGSFRGIFINHNSAHSERVVLENVTIDGTVYTISCDQGLNQGLTATNSTFNGWTSYAKTLGEAEFVDCSFGKSNGYAFCRPYAPTTFVGCDFEAGYTVDPVAAVTFENCTLNGVALTSANIADLVTSTANVTVK